MMNDRMSAQTVDEHASLKALEAMVEGSASSEEKVREVRRHIQARLAALRGERAEPPRERSSDLRPRMLRNDLQEGPAAGKHLQRIQFVGRSIQLVGRSPAMKQIEEAIHRVALSQATVLLRGESGTGKELVARAIHENSVRASGPFIPLHCAAVADTLLESELFGHERGAFTGAHEQRKGKFELADGGTLLLDEIGDIPPGTQIKLLRVLQEKCVERVGGTKSVPVDVRVISATHRDLEAMVGAGSFREDLYYRLNVVPITLPPLREREGDIPLLIAHFLQQLNQDNRRRVRLGADLLQLMECYHWPGNIRELQNCMERLVVLADPHREVIGLETVPSSLRGYFHDMRRVTEAEGKAIERKETTDSRFGTSLQDIERSRLLDALQRTGWIQTRTARLLGLTPRQVAYKIRKYGITHSEET